MSTNYTENYNLCQWEPSDEVLREDFNADNAKLDTALDGLETRLAQQERVTYTDSRPQVAAGAFVGDGASSRLVNVGFRPKAVMVLEQYFEYIYNLDNIQHTYSGYAVDGMQMTNYTPAVTIAGTGFCVYHMMSGKISLETNISGVKYFYIAVR